MNMRKIWNDTTFWLGLSKTEHWEKERTEEERKRDAERQAAWNATPWKDEGLSRQEWEAQGNVDKHSAVRAQMDADFDAETARCVEIRRREKKLEANRKTAEWYSAGNPFRFHPENGLRAKELSETFLVAIQRGYLQKYSVHGVGFPAHEDVSLANQRAVSASRGMSL